MTEPGTEAPPSGSPPIRIDEHGVLTLELFSPAGAETLFGSPLLEALEAQVAHVEALSQEQEVRVVALESRAPGSFLSGADYAELSRIRSAEEAMEWAAWGQRVLRRLEQLPIPTVALVDGACLGAGLELALACSYRLASDAAHTRLGLPEVHLGLIPGFGGTVRLPRLIGVQASLDLILSGRRVDAAEARRLGLVDQVIPARHWAAGVDRFLRERASGGRVRTGARRGVRRRLLEDTAPGRRLVFARAARALGPATEATAASRRALAAVAEGIALPLERAFRQEAEVFGELLATGRSRALIHSARILREAGRTAAPPAPLPVRQAAVLGAGEVGSQFAYLLARADIPLRLRDRKRTAVAAGIQAARTRLVREATLRGLPEDQAQQTGRLIEGASGFGGFGTLDVVVAAVGDRYDTASQALREVEEHVREECILASSSSLLSLTALQETLMHPGRSVGLHLSLPSDGFPLLEIVAGKHTTPETIASCCALARRLGRMPVRVREGPGLIADRLLAAYFAEALRLLQEGYDPIAIDAVAERFGMAVGPFRRMDLLGMKRVVRLMDGLAEALGERLRPAPVLARAHASGEGFFRYRKGRPLMVNPALEEIAVDDAPPEDAVRDRLLLLLVNEAALALDEGIASAEAIDVASLLGLGFPRARGGVLYHAAHGAGGASVVAALERAAERFGERFAPAPLLRRLAERGELLHPWTDDSGQSPASMLG